MKVVRRILLVLGISLIALVGIVIIGIASDDGEPIIPPPAPRPVPITAPEVVAAPPASPAAPELTAKSIMQDNRSNILSIIKQAARDKWGTDFSMVQYENDKQVEAFAWCMAQSDAEVNNAIMSAAIVKWGTDFSMVKYEYTKQLKAYLAMED